jgi:DNA repair photolyase
MTAIYEPKGKAREYAERAVNLYRGCSHGCTYCYAPSVLRMTREKFAHCEPRPGILDAIHKEAPKHAGREVLLCFTCDPYPAGQSAALPGMAIALLQDAGCRVNVLTKSGSRSALAIDLLRAVLDSYGATLTFDNDADSELWEPGAAMPSDRIAMLSLAKSRHIKTWASLEPVIDPEQSLALIRAVAGIADVVKIGRLNHNALAKSIDWPAFARRAVDLCESLGQRYVLKADLAGCLR